MYIEIIKFDSWVSYGVYKKTEPLKFKLAVTYCRNLTGLTASNY